MASARLEMQIMDHRHGDLENKGALTVIIIINTPELPKATPHNLLSKAAGKHCVAFNRIPKLHLATVKISHVDHFLVIF